MASLPHKVVKKILDLEFVEMSELSIIDDELGQTPGHPPDPSPPAYHRHLTVGREILSHGGRAMHPIF